MSENSFTFSRKFIALGLASFLVFAFLATAPLTRVHSQNQICVALKSASETSASCDQSLSYSTDMGGTFAPAVVTDPVPGAWQTITGTKWISTNCTLDGTSWEFKDVWFYTTFDLPMGFSAASLSLQVLVDNSVEVTLNGNNIPGVGPGTPLGAFDDATFHLPGTTFDTSDLSKFVAGTNTLIIKVRNENLQIGLDFAGDVCYTPTTCGVPVVSCSVTQTDLWPPNHQLENVGLAASASDRCGTVALGGPGGSAGIKVYSDEPDLFVGSGNFSPDAKDRAPGSLRLRSERGGPVNGRVYLIVVAATNPAGTGYCTKTVTVPHDQSKASKNSVAAQAAAAKTYFDTFLTPPPGYVEVGNGPIVGPKQ